MFNIYFVLLCYQLFIKGNDSMRKVAITGNIASGKSEVEKILSSLGYKLIDTDEISHSLLQNDEEIKKQILDYFGKSVFDENNNVSRKALAGIVFSDKEKLTRLEKIIHPKVFLKIGEFFNQNKTEKICFVSVPQLFETKTHIAFDKILFISAPEELRKKRLMERNNLSEEEALLRINAQNSEKSKIEKSDFVVYNDKDLNYLKEQVSAAAALLLLLP